MAMSPLNSPYCKIAATSLFFWFYCNEPSIKFFNSLTLSTENKAEKVNFHVFAVHCRLARFVIEFFFHCHALEALAQAFTPRVPFKLFNS